MENEAQIRLISFALAFLVMAGWEFLAPYRRLRFKRIERWPHQIALMIINAATLKLLFPFAAIAVATWAKGSEFGALNVIEIPGLLAVVIAIVLLDLALYTQHVLSHRWNWLWRIHRTHHIDTDFDLTTGLRFHPFEMALSMIYKMALIIILGLPPFAVLIFEIILSASSIFNHANIALPKPLEMALRWIIVTPGMHRIHHSTKAGEHNSNYGFFFSGWDRMFNSYTERASEDDRTMPIGLDIARASVYKRIDKMLMIPFM